MPESEPILKEDVDKLTDKIWELELENTQLQVQLIPTKQHNKFLEDNSKLVEEEFEVNKKRLREVEGTKVWVDGAMLWANSELDFRNNKLDQAYHTIKYLEKIVEWSNAMKKEAREDYVAQILELRTILKECKDLLAQEKLEMDKVYRRYLSEQIQLGRACEQIKNLNIRIYNQACLELQNDHQYWEDRCLSAKASMAQIDGIIQNLQVFYDEWKNKYENMVVLTNYTLQDFPEKLKEANLVMFPKNTPLEVFNLVKFCNRTMAELITNIEALRKSQGVTFRVDI